MAQVIKRGIIQSFNAAAYTASVLLMEATSTFLDSVPLSTTLDGSSAVPGGYCAVLFFDEHNQQDAVVIAVYPNGSQGVPAPPPGRITFTTPYVQLSGVTINAGVTNTYQLNGGGSGLPSGILGVLYRATFSSATVGAYLQMAPHSGTIGNYHFLGNIQVANQYVNTPGVLQVDSAGSVDIKANGGNCLVTLWTHGYVI